MRTLTILPALALAAACTPEAPPADAGPNECPAASLQTLVGQPESAVAAMTFATPMRLLRPGMAVTMDYRPDRLNIEVDRAGRVVRVFCG
jgi:hypothetical protein